MLRQKALPAKGHFALWTSVLRKSYVDDALAIFGGAKLGVGVVYSLVPKLSSPIFLEKFGRQRLEKISIFVYRFRRALGRTDKFFHQINFI